VKPAESLAAVAVVAGYYPRSDFPPETIALWAQSIQKYDQADAIEAARILGEGGKWEPSLSEWLLCTGECWRDRMKRQGVALPEPKLPGGSYYPFALFLHEHPLMADRVKALQDTQHAGGCIVPALADELGKEMKAPTQHQTGG
jgi:hypothetical protein